MAPYRLIHRKTRAVFLASESLPEAGADHAETALDELGAGLSRDVGATVRPFVVDAAAPRIG